MPQLVLILANHSATIELLREAIDLGPSAHESNASPSTATAGND